MSMSERVLICGDRGWCTGSLEEHAEDFRAIYDYVKTFPAGTVIIHGAQGGIDSKTNRPYGADYVAGLCAGMAGLTVEEYPADWNQYGKAAGPKRNTQMLEVGKPTRVAYAHRKLRNSKGTKDMIVAAVDAGLPVESIVRFSIS